MSELCSEDDVSEDESRHANYTGTVHGVMDNYTRGLLVRVLWR